MKGLDWLFESMGRLDKLGCLHMLVDVQNHMFDKIGVDSKTRKQLFGAFSPASLKMNCDGGQAKEQQARWRPVGPQRSGRQQMAPWPRTTAVGGPV